MHFSDNEEEGKELSELVTRFEKMIHDQQPGYFDSDELCEIIDYYFQWLNLNMAFKALELGEQHFPNDEEILIRKVRALSYEQRTREALKILSDMEKLHPDFSELYIERGHIYLQMALLEQSLENYKKALSLCEQKEDLYFYMGSVCSQMEKWEEAAFYYKKALRLNPDFEEAMHPYCEAMIRLSKTEECIRVLQQMVDHRPFSFTAWYCLAQVYLFRENYSQALDALEYADAIQPDEPDILMLKSRCLIELDRPVEAVKILQQTMKAVESNDEKAEIYSLLGEAYACAGDFNKALVNYNKSIRNNESHTDSWLGIGTVLMEQSRALEARHYFTKAVELAPFDPDCWYWMAHCLSACGMIEEAIPCYARALELDTLQQETWKEFLLLLIQNRYDKEADEYIIQAMKHFPEDADFHYICAAYYYKKGLVQKAMDFLENGLRLNPENFEYLFMVYPDLVHAENILNRIRKP